MDNPCWEGYEMYGTKMKDGRKVPNCIPKKSTPIRMPYDIMKIGDGKGYVTNTKTGRVFSHSPIPLANAEKQLRLLNAQKNFRGRGVERKDGADSDPEMSASDTEKDPPKNPKKWIQGVVESPKFRKGAFTAKAKKHNMTPMEFMRKVLANPDDYDITTRREAQFLKNIQ